MVNIYTHVAGKTLGCHEKLLKKFQKKGAKVVDNHEESDLTVVFCPIVSRFETDVNEALTGVSDHKKVIVVALHHTFDPNYVLPNHSHLEKSSVVLLVDFLFFETQGLLKCPCNKNSKKMVYAELKKQKTSNQGR